MHGLYINLMVKLEGIGLVSISNVCGIVLVVGNGPIGSCGVAALLVNNERWYCILEHITRTGSLRFLPDIGVIRHDGLFL